LIRLGHLMNVLAQNAARLARMLRRLGQRGLIQLLRETCSGHYLNPARIQRLLASSRQMRLE
jgi:hypothetical protein